MQGILFTLKVSFKIAEDILFLFFSRETRFW